MTYIWLLLVAAVVASADNCDAQAECSSNFGGSDQANIGSTSLLQIASPLRRGTQAFAHQQLAAAAAAAAAADTAAASESSQLSDEFIGAGSQLVQQSEVLGQNVASALKAAQAAQAIEEVHRSNKAAQAAQHSQATRSAEVGQALLGAMQRVQRAGEVESQELAMEDVATRRLQDAARGASQVQALEDEGAMREAHAAELLKEAMGKIETPDQEDSIDSRPLRETLKALQVAQNALAAEASSKVHASQLLQSSLQGAAVAVEALKRGKEEQTATWLRDAGRGLQWMQDRWSQHTASETKVGQLLENASNIAAKAQKLAGSDAAGKKYTAALMQDAAQKARSAENSAARQRNRALQQMREAAALRQFQAMPNYAPQMAMAQDQALQNAYFQGLMQSARPEFAQDVSRLSQAAPMVAEPSLQALDSGNTLLQRGNTLSQPSKELRNAYIQGLMQSAGPEFAQDVPQLNQAAPMVAQPSLNQAAPILAEPPQQTPNSGNIRVERRNMLLQSMLR